MPASNRPVLHGGCRAFRLPTSPHATRSFLSQSDRIEGLDFVFKRSADERFIVDPDLGFRHDIAFKTKDDAYELLAHAFTLDEANVARASLLAAYAPYICKESPSLVELVRIDTRAALWNFHEERRLLRLRRCDDWISSDRLEGLLLGARSARADGIRGEGELFYRRSEALLPQECYAVEALRIEPAARVIARYGHRFETPTGPRARAERFGFIEWNNLGDGDMRDLVTSACRVLQADEAAAIAMSLAANEFFRDVRVTKGTLPELDASEGLGLCSEQTFSQAGPDQEAAVGFAHFLSVFPRLDEELEGSERFGIRIR